VKKNLTGGTQVSEREGRGGTRDGLVRGGSGRLGPGRGPVGLCPSFFCSDSFSNFCFSLFFIYFSNLIQIDSNQKQIFLKFK
jgi:hypothetical protein